MLGRCEEDARSAAVQDGSWGARGQPPRAGVCTPWTQAAGASGMGPWRFPGHAHGVRLEHSFFCQLGWNESLAGRS